MVRQQLRDRHFIEPVADLGLFTKQTEAGHGRFDRVHVNAPQVHEEHDFQLQLGMLGHRNIAAHVGVVLVVEQKGVPQNQDLAQPLENVRVVGDLVLHKLLRDGKQNLGTYAPECVDGRLGIPVLDVFFLVEDEQGLHRGVGNIDH